MFIRVCNMDKQKLQSHIPPLYPIHYLGAFYNHQK